MNTEKILSRYLQGNISATERAYLYEKYSEEELDLFVKRLSSLEIETKPVGSEWQKFEDKDSLNSSSKSKPWWILILLALILGMGIFYILNDKRKTITNTTSKPMLIAMADNTAIELAPGSTIKFKEDNFIKNRKLWLDGHAYFDVKTKGDFLVMANEVNVSVLGTKFDIWDLGSKHAKVQCYSGKVEVAAHSGMQMTLIKGQQSVIKEGEMVIEEFEELAPPAWLSSHLNYNGVSLKHVYSEIESYYKIAIIDENPQIKFSGTLPLDNIEQVVKILSGVTGKKYTLKDNQVSVSNN